MMHFLYHIGHLLIDSKKKTREFAQSGLPVIFPPKEYFDQKRAQKA